jgi:AcrR family transcriptional regulator
MSKKTSARRNASGAATNSRRIRAGRNKAAIALHPGKLGRAERTAQTRQRILSTASLLFANRGFAAVTTRQISKAAKVTFPVMYRHFANKRTLYLTAFGNELERINAKYIGLLEGEGKPERQLLLFVAELYKDLLMDPFVSKMMQREILDRDDAGIRQLTKGHFLAPYFIVKKLCERVVGESKAQSTASLIYIVTMGFAQFRPIGQVIAHERIHWKDFDNVARLILELVFPGLDWAAIGIPPGRS